MIHQKILGAFLILMRKHLKSFYCKSLDQLSSEIFIVKEDLDINVKCLESADGLLQGIINLLSS